MRIQDITALVTGGASGLGRATVETLHEAGANVVICDLSDARDLAASLGQNAVYAKCDVTSSDDVTAAIDSAITRFGGVHAVVNCAGVGWAGRILNRDGEPHDLDLFEQVLRINLAGTFNVCRLAAAQMSRQQPIGEERGVLVNTASAAAFEGQVGQAAYAASKGGIVSLSLPMARDLASQQIRVVAVAPGLFQTPMADMIPQNKVDGMLEWSVHPKRTGHPSEFAALVRHIIENPFINGTTIQLNAGLHLPPK